MPARASNAASTVASALLSVSGERVKLGLETQVQPSSVPKVSSMSNSDTVRSRRTKERTRNNESIVQQVLL
jgi:hypothetical protein